MIDMIVKRLRSHIRRLLASADEHNSSDSPSSSTPSTVQGSGLVSEVKGSNVLRSLLKRLAEKQIDEEEFIGNVLLIILAGYETSANALSYTLYLLAKHPHIQDKLREQLNKEGKQSKYLEQVWMESLRYFPPVCMFVNRVFSEDMFLNGIQFLKDDILQVPVWAIQHDPNIWPNPFTFDPDRFSEENR
jgi:cytochrome P450